MNKKLYVKNKKGNKLCAILVTPDNKNHSVVILCHGFHSTKDNNTNTRLQAILKEKNIATFRFDFYGHGESDGKFEDITVSEAVEDALCAIEFLKKKGYKKIGIIGASFGGLTGLLTAAKSKDLRFLGLKCPASNFLEIELTHRTKENLEEWKRDGFTYYQNEEGEAYRLNYNFFQDLKKNNAFPVADKIRIPTLIIHGDAVEVSLTTLSEDRSMAFVYAQAGIPEYWLFNLNNNTVEVYTKPMQDRYSEMKTYSNTDILILTYSPEIKIELSSIF